MKFLHKTENGVQVVYTNMEAGCMTVGPGLMLTGSLFILSTIPSTGVLRALLALPIGFMGLLFFGGVLLKIVMVLRKGRVLFEVQGENLLDRKKQVPLREIDEVSFGWHQRRFMGMIFEDLVVRTVQGKQYFFCSYNMVSEKAMKEFIEYSILPFATPHCRAKWEEKKTRAS